MILYTELAQYSIACFKELSRLDVKLLVVHWPINAEAPFNLDLSFIDIHYSRDQLNVSELNRKVREFQPDIILCSGWLDYGYVRLCSKWKSQIPTVVTFDNKWTGSLKQRLAALASPFVIRRSFSHAFVPGEAQSKYAKKLGFDHHHIETGFYSADVAKFNQFFEERQIEQICSADSKRILYLGRYVEHKGVFEMWQAFRQFRVEHEAWELWCVGTGDQYDNRAEYEGIKHFGFLQPDELLPILQQTVAYILPSHFEPWGVSAHEMAVAGFPLLLSDEIGSSEAFLKEGVNGFQFKHGSEEEILRVLVSIASLSQDELITMSQKSHDIGMKITPTNWAKKVEGLTLPR